MKPSCWIAVVLSIGVFAPPAKAQDVPGVDGVQYWDCGNSDPKSSFSKDPKHPTWRACGILARNADAERGFSVTFRVTDEKDHIGRSTDANCPPEWKKFTYASHSFIHIDTDTQYTEALAYTEYSSPVTDQQLTAALPELTSWYADRMRTRAVKLGIIKPSDPFPVQVESRRNPSPGVSEITILDEQSHGAYFRVLAEGNRLYKLIVITDAHEDPDTPTAYYVVEKDRFFHSFTTRKEALLRRQHLAVERTRGEKWEELNRENETVIGLLQGTIKP